MTEKVIENYQVDFYFPKLNTLLEVNGPHHYVYSGEHFNGRHVLKQMVLESAGYQFKNVSYVDYYKQKGTTARL